MKVDERKFLISKLSDYRGMDEREEKMRLAMLKFVQTNPRCFDNSYETGHITGSALVMDREMKYVLLTHHRKLDKWLQFGGHSDGHHNPLEVAWREAGEESGLDSLSYVPRSEGIFDVDVHIFSHNEEMSAHKHYDVRILLTADINEKYKVSRESKDLKWVKIGEVSNYNNEPGLVRMVEKTKKLKEKMKA